MNTFDLIAKGAETVLFYAIYSAAFAFLFAFLAPGRASLGKSVSLTMLRRIIAGIYTPFFVVFSVAFALGAGQQFTGGAYAGYGTHGFSSVAAGFVLLFIAIAGQWVVAPAFSASGKRLTVFAGFIAAGVYSAYQLFYLSPLVAVALFLFWGSAGRIKKSGILNITADSHTPAELRYAQFVMTREYIAPYFLLFTFALVPTGYLSGGIQSMFPLVGGLLNTAQYPLAVLAWLFVQLLMLAGINAFLMYYKLGSYFLSHLDLLNKSGGQQKTLRGAAKATDLQSQLDKQ